MYIDSHCHIHKPELAKRQKEVFAKMQQNDVDHVLCVCISFDDFPDALALAKRYDHIHCTVGVHPGPKPGSTQEPTIEKIVQLANHPKVVGIGETGLDYYRAPPKEKWQIKRFRTQIRAARECQKPLIIHTRQAADDTIKILREEKAGVNDGGPGGIMHCFSEPMNIARAALDMGFYISFSGVLTYPANQQLRSIARLIPLNRLLIETDSPWLSPQACRGSMNEPGNVVEVAKQLAAVKGMSVEKMAQITKENYFRLFNIQK